MLIRGSSYGCKFGIFGKIFRDRLAEVQPITDGGLLDGLDDDADEVERIIRENEQANADYMRALGMACGCVGDDIPVLPIDNVVPFRSAQ